MKPEMMATIREYDPSNTSDPITKAWDSTQIKVCFQNIFFHLFRYFCKLIAITAVTDLTIYIGMHLH